MLSSVRAYVAAVSLPGMPKWQRIANAFLLRPARVAVLAAALPVLNGFLAQGITVIIPIRNRTAARVQELMKSLGQQTIASGLLRVCIVDYGSDANHRKRIAGLAQRSECTVVRVEGKTEWNRSDAVNHGLRKVQTRYLLVSDADLIFEKNYLSEALKILSRSPRALVVSAMLDLPRGASPTEGGSSLSTPRLRQPFHRSIIAASLLPVLWIKGYDPAYRLWGKEDDDFFCRLISFGLRVENVSGSARYFHQWHPKFEGMPEGNSFDDARRSNEELFSRLRRCIRSGCLCD